MKRTKRKLGSYQMANNWKIHPNSKISRIKNPIVRFGALCVRNMIASCRQLKSYLRFKKFYRRLVEAETKKAIELAIYYIHATRVEGDIVEFGSHGVTAKIIATQLRLHKSKRWIHLFDSFQGYPDSDSMWQPGGAFSKKNPKQMHRRTKCILGSESAQIYPGWFSSTLCTIADNIKFAMVLMDCNIYESNYEVLDYLFQQDLLSDRAIILFADWWADPGLSSQKAWSETTEKHSIDYTPAGSYSWGSQKFIIR